MKKLFVLLGVLLLVGTSSVAGAVPISTINFNSVLANGGYSSPVAWALIETFDATAAGGLVQGWTWTPGNGYAIVQGSVSGQYAAPAYQDAFNKTQHDATYYGVVPSNLEAASSNPAVVTLGQNYNYLGLWWGSMDTYNKLELYKGNVLVDTILNADVNGNGSGDQNNSLSNRYVNIYLHDTGKYFDTIKIFSLQKAFELDNIAVANVPEPGTILLLGFGLVGLGLTRFRKNQA